MELILEVINPHSADQSFKSSHRFREAGGLIGRGDQCVWRLPDPSRHLSSQHALIVVEDETFYLEDCSTNGVFVNGADQPLGKGQRHPIADGDEYQMGPFRILARLWSEQAPAMELPESIAQFFDELETSMPAYGHDELAEQLSTRSGEAEEVPYLPELPEEEDLSWAQDSVEVPGLLPLSSIDEPAVEQDPDPALSATVDQSPLGQPVYSSPDALSLNSQQPALNGSGQHQALNGQQPVSNGLQAAPTEAAVANNANSLSASGANGREAEALAAFAASSGLDFSKLSQDELVAVMEGCGALLRDSVKGLMDLLARRSEQKSRFRLGLTLIQRRENNPLKYSVNEVQAIKQLVMDPQPECLPAPQAVKHAVADLSQHFHALESSYQELIREIVRFAVGDELTEDSAARRSWVDRRAQKRSLQKRLATLQDDEVLQREFLEHRFAKLYQYAVADRSKDRAKAVEEKA